MTSFRIEISFMDKQKFLISKKSIQIFIFICNKCILVRLGKGACITRMGALRNYSTNTIIEKTESGRGG